MMTIEVLFSKDCFPRHSIVKQEFLKTPHHYEYNKDTRITDLFRFLFDSSGMFFYEEETYIRDGKGQLIHEGKGRMEITDDMLLELFLIKRGKSYVSLWDKTIQIDKLLTYLGLTDIVELYFESSLEGEGYFSAVECNGIQFYYHSDEAVHWGKPHVHAINHGKEISIDINTFEILAGHFKKSKDEKKAIDLVRKHQLTFMKGWQDNTNGIKVNLNEYFDLESG